MTPHKKQSAALALATAVTTLTLAGCSGKDPASQPSITRQQALTHVYQILQSTGPLITPRPRLEPNKLLSENGACPDEPDGMSDARVQVSRSYFLQGVPKQAHSSIAKQIQHIWKAKGYRIYGTSHLDTANPQVFADTTDGFLMALSTEGNGQLNIGATSPCVWPNGTPPPQH